MFGISSKEIDKMIEEEVIELSTFITKVEEIRLKRLAYEIAKAMWGGKK
jgi:ribosomal protein S6